MFSSSAINKVQVDADKSRPSIQDENMNEESFEPLLSKEEESNVGATTSDCGSRLQFGFSLMLAGCNLGMLMQIVSVSSYAHRLHDFGGIVPEETFSIVEYYLLGASSHMDSLVGFLLWVFFTKGLCSGDRYETGSKYFVVKNLTLGYICGVSLGWSILDHALDIQLGMWVMSVLFVGSIFFFLLGLCVLSVPFIDNDAEEELDIEKLI